MLEDQEYMQKFFLQWKGWERGEHRLEYSELSPGTFAYASILEVKEWKLQLLIHL